MYLNPIVKKDIKVQSRSMRICWGIFAYELILALVFFMAMSIIQGNSRYSSGQSNVRSRRPRPYREKRNVRPLTL